MRVRPRSGLLVRDPSAPATPLPPEGREVPVSVYWTRRLRCGDVELVSEPEPAPRVLEDCAPTLLEDLP